MVSAPNPLATQAGIAILRDGGNAVDAAIAAMVVLCVVESLSVTIGGDCFALVAPQGRLPIHAYNGSGRAPAAADSGWARSQSWTAVPRPARMPSRSPACWNPGNGWRPASERAGSAHF